jgi:hypothetical protein
MLLGALPLAAGLAVHAAWLLTRKNELMSVGIAVVLLGVVSTLIGAVVIALDWRAVTEWTLGVRARAAVAALLLAGCYPAAGVILWHANDVHSRYEVEIVNAGSSAVTACRVVGGGGDVDVGRIAAGGTAHARVYPKRDDTLLCELTYADGTVQTVVVEGYVTNGQGGAAVLTIPEHGAPVVRRVR